MKSTSVKLSEVQREALTALAKRLGYLARSSASVGNPSWHTMLAALADNPDAFLARMVQASVPTADQTIVFTPPRPCGVQRGEGYCGRPATVGHLSLNPEPDAGQTWVLFPMCRQCVEAMVALYAKEEVMTERDPIVDIGLKVLEYMRQGGQARMFHRDGEPVVQFFGPDDGGETIPLASLGYTKEAGFYDKRTLGEP